MIENITYLSTCCRQAQTAQMIFVEQQVEYAVDYFQFDNQYQYLLDSETCSLQDS